MPAMGSPSATPITSGSRSPPRAALMGPGTPFEMAGEEVLGHRTVGVRQSSAQFRDVLLTAAERFGDRPYFVFPDETVTFAEAPVRIAAIAHVLAEEYGVGKGVHVAFASRTASRTRSRNGR